MFNNQVIAGSSGQGGGFYDFPLEQSLRFNDNDSAYLSRTPTTAGNRKTWTFSCWVKRSNLNANTVGNVPTLFAANDSSPGLYNFITFTTNLGSDVIYGQLCNGSSAYQLETSQTFRDVAGWYHIVWSVDTTQATASDRVKLYVNGEQVTSFLAANYPPQNTDTDINNTVEHQIGKFPDYTRYFDGYMAEVNFIDGQQLDPTSFGEFKSGIWIPKDPTGLTYGTNGFRLNFADTVEASGFNALTWTGDAANPKSVNGCGFSPDFVWAKARSSAFWHRLYDSVRGANKALFSNATSAETTDAAGEVTSFDSDGFTFSGSTNNSNLNNNGTTYVAWCWDAGSGSPVSNTDGSITSTVKANTDYGFSVVTYTGTGANATIGHGLGVTPDMYIVKNRDQAGDWCVYHKDMNANPEQYYMLLNTTNAAIDNNTIWNDTAPTSTTFSIGSYLYGNNVKYVAYCFAEKTGVSKFGSYTGTGVSGLSVTGLGFKPAFLMVKSSTAAEGWQILDNTREVAPDEKQDLLVANLANAEVAMSGNVEFTDDGFNVNTTIGNFNLSGQTYIYMAFKDTRDAAFWRDVSGQGNDWQPNNLTFSDVVPDGTNNFCTYNPNSRFGGNGTFSEGNLRFSGNSSGDMSTRTSTVIPAGMKFYFEAIYSEEGGSGGQARLGIDQTGSTRQREKTGTGLFSFDFRGSAGVPQADDEGSLTTYGSQPAEGDVVGIAVDLENGKLYAHKANSYYNSGDPAAGTGAVITGIPDLQSVVFMAIDGGVNYNSWHINFGQDSTFAGRKSAGGNADENGYGDFQYAVPSGFLSLCSANLPKGAIDTLNDETPEDYFNTVLYSGNSTNNTPITVGFEPSMTWIKTRNVARDHRLMDAVRGATAGIYPNLTNAEGASPLLSFDSDGFTLNNTNNYNNTGETYASWNWKAGGAGVSNTDGSITSTVSVGATSQQNWFSVATYTEPSGSFSFGHGLGVTPDMFIFKRRDGAENWIVWHKDFGSPTNNGLYLNSTSSTFASGSNWLTGIDNNTISITSGQVSGAGTKVCYSFANAEGLCKVGSYTGNGSADGSFIYTGFRVSYLLVKITSTTNHWVVWDNQRLGRNPTESYLIPSLPNIEDTAASVGVDFLSNGFKFRGTSAIGNQSGQSFIYLAIAEQPFKYANAR